MPQQQYFKFLREFEDCNISEIAENIGVNWRTAKKYADKEDWNQPILKKSREARGGKGGEARGRSFCFL